MTDSNAPTLREKTAQLVGEQLMTSGKRLGFPDQCTAFAALRVGFRQSLVAEAFGLSAASVSYLNSCHENKAGKKAHYPHVAREYRELGDSAFFDRHFNDDAWTRMARIKRGVAFAGDKRPRGPNRQANTQAYEARGAFMLDGPAGTREHWRIDWTEHNDEPGWRYHVCSPQGDLIGELGYQGVESMRPNAKPFRTSHTALEGLQKMLSGDE